MNKSTTGFGEITAAMEESLMKRGIVKPRRIQLRRTKGWKMPRNTVKVDRSTRWGNPHKVGDETQVGKILNTHHAVAVFKYYLQINTGWQEDVKKNLRGKNLACWCKPGEPCHADVLLEVANE